MRNYFLNKIKEIRLDLIDLIVILSYYLFSILLILSLFGLFNKYWVTGALLTALFFILGLRYQIKLSKYNLYFFIFVPWLFIGFLLFKGYFAGDAFNYWLPWAREIVLQGKMPDFLLNIPFFINSREPFLPLLFAATFLFLPLKAIFVVAIPLFFMAATALLLYQWAQDKGIDKRYLIFIVLLFLTNPITAKYGWDLLQESLIIFFFTAFFYYLEKYQRNNKALYFFLMIFSSVLAVASKLTGLILALPLLLIIFKNRPLKRNYWLALVLIFLPVILWFVRNYIIYGNPMPLPSLFNDLFGGRYYEIIRASSILYSQHIPSDFNSIFTKLSFTIKNILFFFPFVLFSFYGFWREKKSQYAVLTLILFFSSVLVFIGPESTMRYLYPILGLLLIYASVGLKYIKSRFFISFIFFLALFGLLETKLFLSQSHFIASFEKSLDILVAFSQFIYDARLFWAIVLSLFFYLFLFNKKYWPYLILLIFSSYLVKTSTIQISWLNIWLPILFLVFIILIWRYLAPLKELFLQRLIVGYIIILLILNSWGLALMFFAVHHQFIFPKVEAYGILPAAASQIKKLEGDNKDFYIYVAFATYLAWFHNYKVVSPDSYTFYYITNDLRPSNSLTAQEIRYSFQKSNIRYIIENARRPFWQDFFDKIRERPDLFELIFEKQGYSLWKVF